MQGAKPRVLHDFRDQTAFAGRPKKHLTDADRLQNVFVCVRPAGSSKRHFNELAIWADHVFRCMHDRLAHSDSEAVVHLSLIHI